MKRRLIWEISQNDVGKSHLKGRCLDGMSRTIYLQSFLGYVQPIDVGKRIYSVGGIYQVENREQLAARLLEVPHV